MQKIAIQPIPTEQVRAYQAGALDANGQPPERTISDGGGNPCRHCLRDIDEGREMLVLAHRPFRYSQPYAEIGPIFLCADQCEAWAGDDIPDVVRRRDAFLIRGYGVNDRILPGTGGVVSTDALVDHAATLLERADVAYLHLRSAVNSCFQARVERPSQSREGQRGKMGRDLPTLHACDATAKREIARRRIAEKRCEFDLSNRAF